MPPLPARRYPALPAAGGSGSATDGDLSGGRGGISALVAPGRTDPRGQSVRGRDGYGRLSSRAAARRF
ncbi:MAG TPA: hypothetical protein VII33_19425, partial [Nakamurella sp.]